MAEGWSCYTGDGDEKWYYYDENGNVRIHWQEIGESGTGSIPPAF